MTESLQDIRVTIAVTAVVLCVLSFVIHLAGSVVAISKQAAKDNPRALMGGVNIDAAPVPMPDATEFLKAVAALVDSLAKAGPALWSMIGSLLFLLIACLAVGIFPGVPGG